MSTYVNVRAEDLNIGDLVQGRGRLAYDISEHATLEDYVVAVFERRDVETLVMLPAKKNMKVRCDDED